MTRCAIYCRISADKDGRALGVARQEADCRALAERLGWTVTLPPFIDNDVSAFSGKERKEYRALLAAIAAGEVDAVIAYAPDRLYRRLTDLAEFIDTVTAAGCAVQTVAAGEIDLSTASGRQTAKLLGVIAEGESDRTGERIRRKLAQNRAEGKPHGGHRPYGWEPDRMTIREAEAAWIRWGVRQTVAGVPIRAQFRELNAKGVTTSIGRPWNHATWRGVLTTARHAGLMADGVSPASWPQIITPEDHRAVLRVLSAPERVTTPGRGGRLHLLSGLAVCAMCGEPVRVGKSKGRRTEAYDVYRCYAKDSGGRQGEVVRHREHVDTYVRTVVAEFLRHENVARLLVPDRDEDARAARERAETEAGRLRTLIDDAAAEHGRLGLPMSALAAYVAPLQVQLATAEKAAEAPRDRSGAFDGAQDADDPGAWFLALPTDRQRVVIGLLFDIRIGKGPRGNVFRPDGIDITRRPAWSGS